MPRLLAQVVSACERTVYAVNTGTLSVAQVDYDCQFAPRERLAPECSLELSRSLPYAVEQPAHAGQRLAQLAVADLGGEP